MICFLVLEDNPTTFLLQPLPITPQFVQQTPRECYWDVIVKLNVSVLSCSVGICFNAWQFSTTTVRSGNVAHSSRRRRLVMLIGGMNQSVFIQERSPSSTLILLHRSTQSCAARHYVMCPRPPSICHRSHASHRHVRLLFVI